MNSIAKLTWLQLPDIIIEHEAGAASISAAAAAVATDFPKDCAATTGIISH